MAAKKLKPGVTVVTPALPDRSHFLAEAVASVAAQTLKPASHLIAVDHEHRGPGRIINQLSKAAQTEWLSILADDDLYDPDHLETLMGVSGNADIVLSWCRFDGKDEEQYRGEFSTYDLLQKQDTGMRGTFMFRKRLWERIGWPDGFLDDWQFLCNAVKAKARFVPVYRVTWTYRRHGNSVSDAVAAMQRGEKPEQTYYLARHI